MPKLTLAALGKLVREKRGTARLREVAGTIGISPATLMRIESGRVPDLETFGKVCRWLGINPGDFLGFDPTSKLQDPAEAPVRVSAHFRLDKLPRQETVNALARMLLFVAEREASGAFEDAES